MTRLPITQFKKRDLGNSLVVQWLRLHTSRLRLHNQVLSLVEELRSHMYSRKKKKDLITSQAPVHSSTILLLPSRVTISLNFCISVLFYSMFGSLNNVL